MIVRVRVAGVAPGGMPQGTDRRFVIDRTGRPPRELRLLHAAGDLVGSFPSQRLPALPLPQAHQLPSQLEEDIRAGQPYNQDAVVGTEP